MNKIQKELLAEKLTEFIKTKATGKECLIFIEGFTAACSNKSGITFKIDEGDLKHLEWIYGRLVNVHEEKENFDYMLTFENIINELRTFQKLENEKT